MGEKRKRGQNYTAEDKEKLLCLLNQYKDTILSKKTDGTTNEAKAAAWVSIAAKFNCSELKYR